MNKKILFAFIFAFITLFNTSVKSYAACTPVSGRGCGSGTMSCPTPKDTYCCTGGLPDCQAQTVADGGSTTTGATGTCVPRPVLGCGVTMQFSCSLGGGLNGKQYCCDTQNACNQITQGTPIGNQLAGKTDPTCSGGTTINTAIGCIDFKATDVFVSKILLWGSGIGGGIAFLLILFGGFSVMTSAGNPERLKDGQSIISSAVSGLILLILCIFVLKFVGIDILGLDAFGFGK